MGDVLGYWAVQDLLPEHASMLMLDRLQVADDGVTGRGVKAVSMDEPFFQGHFPVRPIMPGVLQIAAMVQLSSAIVKSSSCSSAVFELRSLRRVKFRKPIFPGDYMQVESTIEMLDDGTVGFKASCSVDGQATSSCSGTLSGVTAGAPEPVHTSIEDGIAPNLDAEEPSRVGIEEVMGFIPHRFPFLLVDRIAKIEGDSATGVKNISGNEPCFTGMRNVPFPGYLQVEAAAQVGCALVLSRPENHGKLGYFMSIDRVEFLEPVFPGDQMIIHLAVTGRGRFGTGEGAMYVGSRKVTEAALKFAIVDAE